jgi:hypothetical protein
VYDLLFPNPHTYSMSKHQHGVCIIVVCLGAVCNLALSIENNESRLVHLPKEEFIKVMSEIISGGADPSMVETAGDGEDDGAGGMIAEGEGGPGVDGEQYGEYFDSAADHPASLTWRTASESSNRGNSEGKRLVRESPRTEAFKEAQQRSSGGTNSNSMNGDGIPSRRKNKRIKNDSLFYLQKSMQTREALFNSSRTGSAFSTARSDYYFAAEDHILSTEA